MLSRAKIQLIFISQTQKALFFIQKQYFFNPDAKNRVLHFVKGAKLSLTGCHYLSRVNYYKNILLLLQKLNLFQ